MSDEVVVIGGGGHARVVIDCIRDLGDKVVGILDDGLRVGYSVSDVSVIGRISEHTKYPDKRFVIAIGDNSVRGRIAEQMDVDWYTAVHPRAVVSHYARLGAGAVVMPNAVINSGATVGRHCIINTGAIVEHDDTLGDFVHISPNASLGGTVSIGSLTHIGIGATVKNNISICEGCVVGAGAVVVKNITECGTYVGIPARKR